MKKERKVIEENAIIVFDQDVSVSEINNLLKDFHGDIVINGELLIDEDLHVECNLHVMKYIVCIPEHKIDIKGDLYCYSEMAIYNACIEGLFYCEGNMSVDNIKVSESFLCKNKIEAYGGRITVFGDFECYGIKAKTVESYGKTYMEGPISIRNFIKSGY